MDRDSNSKEAASGGGLSMSVVLFVLNIVILYNTTLEGFQLVMPHGTQYHDFHTAMLWASVTMIILFGILVWLSCVTICSENDRLSVFTSGWGVLTILGILAMGILQYVKLGELWHTDPDHTMFWYGSYWSEGVTHFPDNATVVVKPNLRGVNATVYHETLPHWPYVMSDVVVRIYGFLLMFITVMLGLIVCCGGTAYGCSRCC